MFLIELTPDVENTIRIVWWIGLIVALIVTAIDVHLLLRVILAAKTIAALADRTLEAAGGIAGNTSALKNLTATNEVAAALIANATPIVAVADAIDKKLSAVSTFFGGGKK
jgi:cell division protein FtsB